jgi:hypothetical protein
MDILSWSRERCRARLVLLMMVLGLVMGLHAIAPGHARAYQVDCSYDPTQCDKGGSGTGGSLDPTDPSTQVSYPDPDPNPDPSTQVSYPDPDPTDPSTQVSYPDPDPNPDPSTQVSYPDPTDPLAFPLSDAITGAGSPTQVCADQDPASSHTPLGPAYAQAFDAYLACRAALGRPLPQSVIDGVTGLIHRCDAQAETWHRAFRDAPGSAEEQVAYTAYRVCCENSGLPIPPDPLAHPLDMHRVAPPGGERLIGASSSAVQQASNAHAATAAAKLQAHVAMRAAMRAAIKAQQQARTMRAGRPALGKVSRKHSAKRRRG